MNKGIIIIGEPLSGKSLLAKQLVENYKKEHVVLIQGNHFLRKNSFPFQSCTEETKVLLIDDVLPKTHIHEFYSILNGNVLINKLGEESFEIKIEKLIIICSAEIKESDLPTDESFKRRFEIINLNSKDYKQNTGMSFFLQNEEKLAKNLQNQIEKNNRFKEMFSWLKEAFGNHKNEDYGNFTLSEYIDDNLKEFDN